MVETITSITYTASSLEDIAELFDQFAENSEARRVSSRTQRDALITRTEERMWREAAQILRSTILKGEQK